MHDDAHVILVEGLDDGAPDVAHCPVSASFKQGTLLCMLTAHESDSGGAGTSGACINTQTDSSTDCNQTGSTQGHVMQHYAQTFLCVTH